MIQAVQFHMVMYDPFPISGCGTLAIAHPMLALSSGITNHITRSPGQTGGPLLSTYQTSFTSPRCRSFIWLIVVHLLEDLLTRCVLEGTPAVVEIGDDAMVHFRERIVRSVR